MTHRDRVAEKATGSLQEEKVAGSVVAMAFDYPSGFEVTRHRHRRSQLVFAARGVMTIAAAMGSWVLPSQRALWMPAGVAHGIRAIGEVRLRTVYIDPQLIGQLPDEVQVLSVPDLLRELILRAITLGPTVLERSDPESAPSPLVRLLLQEIEDARSAPLHVLHLPKGTDPRLRRLMALFRETPGDPAPLRVWGKRVGASERTLARLFAKETGLGFVHWRQLLRLQRALELLANGKSVSQVALDVGYESLSAFITMFRRATGLTPTQYKSTGPDNRRDRLGP